MLKAIQHFTVYLPSDGTFAYFPTSVNPAKVYIEVSGEGFQHSGYFDGTDFIAYAWQVPVVISDISSSGCSFLFSGGAEDPILISVQLIEYL